MSDLDKLLLGPLMGPLAAKKKPRPPVRANPRPRPPRSVSGPRPASSLDPDYFQVKQNRPAWEALDPERLTPRPKPSTTTVTHSPNTGQRRPLGLSTPVEGDWSHTSFSSGGDFGPRTHPVHGRSSNHTGLDFGLGMGEPIYAPRAGVVEAANPNAGAYGNQIILRHGPKLQTMYGHTSKFNVEPGQKVARGDIIGFVGSTGLSTGPHLHWETWRDGTPVDPRNMWNPDAPRRAPRQPRVEQASAPTEYKGPPTTPQDLAFLLGAADSRKPRGGGPRVPPPVSQDPRLSAFLKAISTQESGGNYGAVGVPTKYGTAYGKYQILDANIEGPSGWDQEALGRNIDINEFLNTPEIQEKIARAKLTEYYKQYGPGGAAAAWYAGPGNAMVNSNSPQYGGPSINGYRDSVLAHMRQFL